MIPHKDEYLLKGGGLCPWCKSNQIEGGHVVIEGNEAIQIMKCLDCEEHWYDVYKLMEVRES